MPITAELTYPYLKKLRCAYTGGPVKVMMTGTKAAEQMYFVAGASDPGDWQPSAEALMKLLGTRGGVEGAARNGAELACPYTGKRMSIEKKVGFGFRAVNGFRPSIPVKDPFLLAANMMTRGGVTPPGAPKPARVVIEKIEDKTPDAAPTQVATKDEALQAAEDILKDDLPTKTTITVPKIGE
jgi:hypothetical protein